MIRSHKQTDKQTGSSNPPPSNHLGANLKNLRASFRCQWCHKRSAFLVSILAQVSGRANWQTRLKDRRHGRYRRVLPLRRQPSQQSPPPTAYSGSRTPRQGTQRQDLAGSFPPTEPRFPGPRFSPPGRQRPSRHHATDSASWVRGVHGIRTGARRRTPTRLPFPNTPFQASPWRPLHLRGTGAASRPSGTNSRVAGGSEVKGDRRARAHRSDALPEAWLSRHRACGRSLPRDQRTFGLPQI